jgi:hypothetical protein
MIHLLWVLPLVAGLAARWLGKLEGVAVLVALICGLIGLAYLVMRPGGYPLRGLNRNGTRATSSETYRRRRVGDAPRNRAQPVALKLDTAQPIVCLLSGGNPG